MKQNNDGKRKSINDKNRNIKSKWWTKNKNKGKNSIFY